jgi:hypothetical protein
MADLFGGLRLYRRSEINQPKGRTFLVVTGLDKAKDEDEDYFLVIQVNLTG